MMKRNGRHRTGRNGYDGPRERRKPPEIKKQAERTTSDDQKRDEAPMQNIPGLLYEPATSYLYHAHT